MRRFWLLLTLGLALACSEPQVARSGYVITSFASAEHGLRPGDTLWEGLSDTFPAAVRNAIDRLANPRIDRRCQRVFARDSLLFFYLPPTCRRNPSPEDYISDPVAALLTRNGIVLDSSGAAWIIGTICPSQRLPDGGPSSGLYYRLDGCSRRSMDTPESLLTRGVDTRFGVIIPGAVTRGINAAGASLTGRILSGLLRWSRSTGWSRSWRLIWRNLLERCPYRSTAIGASTVASESAVTLSSM
jgi:hypothetical protein